MAREARDAFSRALGASHWRTANAQLQLGIIVRDRGRSAEALALVRPAHATLLAELGPDPILVGHSFGASVLLKYLAEGTHKEPIAGLFLVSTPFWGADFPDFALPPDFAGAVSDIPTFLYHSRDDPEIPLSHLRRFQEYLPNATSRVIEGSEHSFIHGLPVLVQDIQVFSATSSNTG